MGLHGGQWGAYGGFFVERRSPWVTYDGLVSNSLTRTSFPLDFLLVKIDLGGGFTALARQLLASSWLPGAPWGSRGPPRAPRGSLGLPGAPIGGTWAHG